MKEFVCIECPKGCRLTIDENLNVTGNTCIRGKNYAINEVTCPKRIVTSTVVVNSKIVSRLPVMTENDIPKEKMFDIMKALDEVQVSVPVKCRDIIIENVCGTGVNIIATRSLDK